MPDILTQPADQRQQTLPHPASHASAPKGWEPCERVAAPATSSTARLYFHDPNHGWSVCCGRSALTFDSVRLYDFGAVSVHEQRRPLDRLSVTNCKAGKSALPGGGALPGSFLPARLLLFALAAGWDIRSRRAWPVRLRLHFNSSASLPKKTISPPRSPGPGPMSRMRSVARTTSRSRSTTRSALPAIVPVRLCCGLPDEAHTWGCSPVLLSARSSSIATSRVRLGATSTPMRSRFAPAFNS
jgi:hypothetical protein